jgi:hypothetical protein
MGGKCGNRQRIAPDANPSLRNLTLNRSIAFEAVHVSNRRICSKSAGERVAMAILEKVWRIPRRRATRLMTQEAFLIPSILNLRDRPLNPNTRQLVFHTDLSGTGQTPRQGFLRAVQRVTL